MTHQRVDEVLVEKILELYGHTLEGDIIRVLYIYNIYSLFSCIDEGLVEKILKYGPFRDWNLTYSRLIYIYSFPLFPALTRG